MNIINSILEVQDFITKKIEDGYNPEKIIVASDWDNTISQYNGCYSPLREGQNTIDFFENLNLLGIPWFVITSRFRGKSPSELYKNIPKGFYKKDDSDGSILTMIEESKNFEKHFNHCIYKSIQAMKEALPPLQNANLVPLFRLNEKQDTILQTRHVSDYSTFLKYAGYNTRLSTYSMLCENVIYGGTNRITYQGKEVPIRKKGEIVIDYINMKILPYFDEFHFIIFIDNDYYKVMEFLESFKDINKENKVYGFHFPMERSLRKGKCNQNEFIIENCFKDKELSESIKDKSI